MDTTSQKITISHSHAIESVRRAARLLPPSPARLLVVCAVVAALAARAMAQAPLETAIAKSFPPTKATASRGAIVTPGAVMTLKKDNVIMFAVGAQSQSTLIYKEGRLTPTLTTRMAAFALNGRPAANIVQRTYVAGEKLWLVGIQTASDSVTLQFLSDPLGYYRYTTGIRFPFPKGGKPANDQMLALIGQVISPDKIDEKGRPAAQAVRTAPAWRVAMGTDPDGAAVRLAELAGTGTASGNRGDAELALNCATAEVRVRRTLVPMATSFFCMDMDGGYLAARFKVGERPFEGGSICGEDDTNPPTPVVKLPIDLGAGGLEEILASPGSSALFEVSFGDKPSERLNALFQLPQDASAIEYLRACHKPTVDTPQPWVNRCPTLAGKGLRAAALLNSAGREYPNRDPENTIGVAWNIPKPTRPRQVRPALHWACSYGIGAKPPADPEALEKIVVPVSPAATSCSLRGPVSLGELEAECN